MMDDEFAAGIRKLIDCLEPGYRLVINRVPIGDKHEDFYQLQVIPPTKLTTLQSIIRRKAN